MCHTAPKVQPVFGLKLLWLCRLATAAAAATAALPVWLLHTEECAFWWRLFYIMTGRLQFWC